MTPTGWWFAVVGGAGLVAGSSVGGYLVIVVAPVVAVVLLLLRRDIGAGIALLVQALGWGAASWDRHSAECMTPMVVMSILSALVGIVLLAVVAGTPREARRPDGAKRA